MKKILLCLLLTATMLFPLTACSKGNDKDSDTTTAPVTTAPPEVETVLELFSAGKSNYKIIRSDKLPAGNGIITACAKLQQTIRTKTGVLIPYETDWLAPNAAPTEYEILVGDTLREESQAAKAELTFNNFTVRVSGNKLLIIGGSDSATCDAVDYFISTFINPLADGTDSLSFSSEYDYLYNYDYRVHSFKLLGADISEYAIVIPTHYSASEYRTAVLLKNHIMNNCGTILTILHDSDANDKHEILIGNTVRSGEQPTGQTFAVSSSDKTFYLKAASMFAYIEMQNYLFDTLFDPAQKDISVDSGFSYSRDVTDTLSGGSESVLSKSGEIRVMFNNMFGNCNAELYPRLQRQQQLFELYTEYDPDVLGLQECNPASRVGDWGIDKLLTGVGYAEVKPSGASGDNYTPLFYKTATVKLIDSGYKRFSNGKGDTSKSFTWGVFEVISTGKRFGVLSTHFWWKSVDASDNEARLSDAGEVIAAVKNAMATNNVPFIIGGDMNCNKSSGPYTKLTGDGYTDPSKTAGITENVNSHHSYPVYNIANGIYDTPVFPSGVLDNSIDHILTKGTGASMKRYEVVTDLYALLSSDHCPIFVDFDLN